MQFTVDTAANQDGVDAVLSQQKDGRIIAYAIRVLTKPERQYCTTHCEMLALVWAVQYFKPYLSGRPFVVRTNYSALQSLRNFKDLQRQVARWLEILSKYDSSFCTVLVSNMAMLTLCQDFHASNVGCQSCQKWLILALLA